MAMIEATRNGARMRTGILREAGEGLCKAKPRGATMIKGIEFTPLENREVRICSRAGRNYF